MKYILKDFNEDVNGQEISFYEMNEDGTTEGGTTLEAMLGVCIERLTTLDEKFPCSENELSLGNMRSALGWLHARTEDRKRREVEGKHEA